MRISDWSSDVCSSDLLGAGQGRDGVAVNLVFGNVVQNKPAVAESTGLCLGILHKLQFFIEFVDDDAGDAPVGLQVLDVDDARSAVFGAGFLEPIAAVESASVGAAEHHQVGFAGFYFRGRRDDFGQEKRADDQRNRSEEHTSELQSQMR